MGEGEAPDLGGVTAGIHAVADQPIFATEVFRRVVFATILALGLQWFTTGAAIHVHVHTPPKGFGCRAVFFLTYGVASMVVFWTILFSSVLAHLARRQGAHEKRSGLKTFIGYLAVFTRWLGKFVAITNGLGILVSSTVQFTGVLDNCFCASTVFGGVQKGVVWFMEDVQKSVVYGPWNVAIGMAFAMSVFYGGIVSAPPEVVFLMENIWSLCKELFSLFRICVN